VEATARVHRQRRGLPNYQDRLVLVQHLDVRGHGRLDVRREDLNDALAAAHDVVFSTDAAAVVFKTPGLAARLPLCWRNLREKLGQRFQQGPPVESRGDVHRAAVFPRDRARQGIGNLGDRVMKLRDPLGHAQAPPHSAFPAGGDGRLYC